MKPYITLLTFFLTNFILIKLNTYILTVDLEKLN